jgi:hypothetical protein
LSGRQKNLKNLQPGAAGDRKNEKRVMDGSKRADELISIFSPVAVGELSARLQVCDLGEIVGRRCFAVSAWLSSGGHAQVPAEIPCWGQFTKWITG